MTDDDTRNDSPSTEDTEDRNEAEVKDLELSEAAAEQVRGGGSSRHDGQYLNHNEVLTTSA